MPRESRDARILSRPMKQLVANISAKTKQRHCDDEKLIKLVESYPVLYDVTHRRYVDCAAKVEVWQEIGKQLRSTAAACKGRWHNIRDNYRKSLKKRYYGGVLRVRKTYKFANMLGFMLPFFKARDPDYEESDDTNEAGNDDSSQESDERAKGDQRTKESDQKTKEGDQTTKEGENRTKESDARTKEPIGSINLKSWSQTNGHDNGPEMTTTIKVDKFEIDDDEPMVEQNEPMVEQNDPLMEQSEPIDHDYFSKEVAPTHPFSFPVFSEIVHPVDAFLAGLSPTLKGMSPRILAQAKAEVFAVVHRHELESLLEQQTSRLTAQASVASVAELHRR